MIVSAILNACSTTIAAQITQSPAKLVKTGVEVILIKTSRANATTNAKTFMIAVQTTTNCALETIQIQVMID